MGIYQNSLCVAVPSSTHKISLVDKLDILFSIIVSSFFSSAARYQSYFLISQLGRFSPISLNVCQLHQQSESFVLLTLCILGNFSCLLLSSDFFQNYLYKKIISETVSECQTVCIQIRADILSALIWVQTVYIGQKQATKVATSKEGVNNPRYSLKEGD